MTDTKPPAEAAPKVDTKDVVQKAGTNGTTIQLYTNAILEQGNVEIPAGIDDLKDFNAHVDAAQVTARTWGRDMAPKLFQTLTNMIDYGGQFGAYYPKLLKAAERVDDPHYRDLFIGGFDRLTKKVSAFEAQAVARRKDLLDFKDLVVHDNQNLSRDLDVMRSHGKGTGSVASLEAELAGVKSLLADTEDAISDMRGLQGASIAGIALGILTGPFAPIVIGASIYGTADTTEQISDLNDARDQQKKDVLRLTREIASLKSELAFCGAHVGNLESIVSKCSGAILGLDREAQSWALLGQSLTATSDGLKRAEIESFWLAEDLAAANAMWTGTVDFATAMRRNQSAPVQRHKITA